MDSEEKSIVSKNAYAVLRVKKKSDQAARYTSQPSSKHHVRSIRWAAQTTKAPTTPLAKRSMNQNLVPTTVARPSETCGYRDTAGYHETWLWTNFNRGASVCL